MSTRRPLAGPSGRRKQGRRGCWSSCLVRAHAPGSRSLRHAHRRTSHKPECLQCPLPSPGVLQSLHADAEAVGMLPAWRTASSVEQVERALLSLRAGTSSSDSGVEQAGTSSSRSVLQACPWLPWFYEVWPVDAPWTAEQIAAGRVWVLWGCGEDAEPGSDGRSALGVVMLAPSLECRRWVAGGRTRRHCAWCAAPRACSGRGQVRVCTRAGACVHCGLTRQTLPLCTQAWWRLAPRSCTPASSLPPRTSRTSWRALSALGRPQRWCRLCMRALAAPETSSCTRACECVLRVRCPEQMVGCQGLGTLEIDGGTVTSPHACPGCVLRAPFW